MTLLTATLGLCILLCIVFSAFAYYIEAKLRNLDRFITMLGDYARKNEDKTMRLEAVIATLERRLDQKYRAEDL